MQSVLSVVRREFVLVEWDGDAVVFGFGVRGVRGMAPEGAGWEAAHCERL